MTKGPICKQCFGPNTKHRKRKGKPCLACSLANHQESIRAMREKKGPLYEKWLQRWQQATGLTLSPEIETSLAE